MKNKYASFQDTVYGEGFGKIITNGISCFEIKVIHIKKQGIKNVEGGDLVWVMIDDIKKITPEI